MYPDFLEHQDSKDHREILVVQDYKEKEEILVQVVSMATPDNKENPYVHMIKCSRRYN